MYFTSHGKSFRASLTKSTTPEMQHVESKLHVPREVSLGRRREPCTFSVREKSSDLNRKPLPCPSTSLKLHLPLLSTHTTPITPPTCSRSTPSPPRDAIEPNTDDEPPTAVLPGPSALRRSARLPRPSGLSPPPSSASPAPPPPARMEESTRSLVPSSTVCPSPPHQRRHRQLCARREKQPANVCAQSSLTPRRSLPF